MRALMAVLLIGCGGAPMDKSIAMPDGATTQMDGALAGNDGGADMADAKVDLAIAADAAEPACGVAGKPCCGGVTDSDGGLNRGGTCDADSACYPFSTASLCKPCGTDDAICCTGATPCNVAGDVCRPTDSTHGVYAPTCYPCGGVGMKACPAPTGCWAPGSTPNPEDICQ